MLTCVLVLAGPPSSQAYETGIGDQQPAMFSSPLFQALHVKIARYIVPYDVMDSPGDLTSARAWLAAAKTQGIEPLIAFYHSRVHPTRIPSVGVYTNDVKRFIKQFPQVTEYEPWNEVNRGNVNSGRTKFHSPTASQSAAFYEAMRGVCDGCTIVGLDLLDSQHLSATLRYLAQFKRAVKHMPDLWGLHNYTDTNRFENKTTKAITRAVPGHVWLTETGGIVKLGHSFPNKHHKGEKRAARALRYMFKLADASSSKIQRLYIFDWTGAGASARFDAGLVTAAGKARAGYSVVRQHLVG
jgi:hypothetical protein